MEFHPWDSEPQVGNFLKSLVELHCSKKILEIGVFRGFTSNKLIEASIINKGDYTGIDIEDHRIEEIKEKFENTNSWFIQNNSLIVLESFVKENKKFDFIFIDSFHSYEQVSNEFNFCKSIITKNGLIAFHDSILHEGVREFILELKRLSDIGNLSIEIMTFNTPEIEGRGGASGLSLIKFL
jgi:predicted O-methyltransferase YrrM